MTQTRPVRLIAPLTVFALVLSLAACDRAKAPTAAQTQTQAHAPPPAAKPRRCPDPDNRDANDPCSVAYLKRTPGRLSERNLP